MSEWARPGADDPSEPPRFEIPLAGSDVEHGEAPTARAGVRRRKVIAVTGIAGVVLGTVVGVVIVADGDDAGDETTDPTTTLDAELSGSITVPPTLAPITPDEPPGAPISGRRIEPLPTIAEVDHDSLGAYDLDAGLAALDESVPRRAHTRFVAGADGFVLDVDVLHDSLNDRYRIEIRYGDEGPDLQVVLIDARGEWSYVGVDVGVDGEGQWVRVPNAEIAEQTGSGVGALARSILLGPVRSDTGPSVVDAAGVVSLDGTPVREYTIEVAAGAVPEWAPYVLSPSAEAPPPPADDLLVFTVHVDGDARLRRVAGASAYGSTDQTIVHTLERLPRLEPIDLPTNFALLDEDGEVVTDSAQLVPEYEPVTDEPPTGDHDLVAALAALTESPPLRATVELLGAASTVITAERDPATGVVAVTTGAFGTPSMLIDTTTDRAFLATEDGSYAEDARVDGRAHVTGLLQGAIEPSALAAAEPVGFLRREDRTVRRFDTTVAPTSLRSAGVGFGVGRDVPIPVRVLVDAASRVVEIHVLSTGGVPEALVQRFEHDAEAPTVTLPVDSG